MPVNLAAETCDFKQQRMKNGVRALVHDPRYPVRTRPGPGRAAPPASLRYRSAQSSSALCAWPAIPIRHSIVCSRLSRSSEQADLKHLAHIVQVAMQTDVVIV